MRNAPAQRNILFVNTTLEVYGAELSLLPVVRSLSPSWKAYFLVRGAGPLDTLLRNEGFPVDCLPLGFRGGSLRKARRVVLLRLLYLLHSRRIQLVHMNLHYAADLAFAACAMAGIPIVVHVRNMIELPVASSFRKYDAIICISQAVRDSLIAQGQVPPREVADRLWIIPDGRDLFPFRTANRDRVRRELAIDSTVPLIGMAARITAMKGQDIFLRMAALIKQRVPAARFLLVGSTFSKDDEPYLRDLHGLVSSLGLHNDVIFAGYRHDMPDVLAAMDCFAHPSRRGAFVSVLIETMASGVPIVASDVDGIPECVGRDGAAVLLPPDEPAAWADAVVGIVADADVARRLAEKGRERASRLFDIAPLARLTTEVLETVYEHHGTPHRDRSKHRVARCAVRR
jgi:glycosyltransferase involved in cell wall biosynthesis